MTRIFAWHRSGWNARPYPVLWEDEIPSHTGNSYAAIVIEAHPLTEEDERVIATSNRRALDILAERYPNR